MSMLEDILRIGLPLPVSLEDQINKRWWLPPAPNKPSIYFKVKRGVKAKRKTKRTLQQDSHSHSLSSTVDSSASASPPSRSSSPRSLSATDISATSTSSPRSSSPPPSIPPSSSPSAASPPPLPAAPNWPPPTSPSSSPPSNTSQYDAVPDLTNQQASCAPYPALLQGQFRNEGPTSPSPPTLSYAASPDAIPLPPQLASSGPSPPHGTASSSEEAPHGKAVSQCPYFDSRAPPNSSEEEYINNLEIPQKAEEQFLHTEDRERGTREDQMEEETLDCTLEVAEHSNDGSEKETTCLSALPSSSDTLNLAEEEDVEEGQNSNNKKEEEVVVEHAQAVEEKAKYQGEDVKLADREVNGGGQPPLSSCSPFINENQVLTCSLPSKASGPSPLDKIDKNDEVATVDMDEDQVKEEDVEEGHNSDNKKEAEDLKDGCSPRCFAEISQMRRIVELPIEVELADLNNIVCSARVSGLNNNMPPKEQNKDNNEMKKDENSPQPEPTEERLKCAEAQAAKKSENEGKSETQERNELVIKSTFHKNHELFWIVAPRGSKCKAINEKFFIPKQREHVWTGHTKDVRRIRFSPNYNDLMLSASMDSKIKIWDVVYSKHGMRTYMGHQKEVYHVSFSKEGSKFLSFGYDKNIRYMDTEIDQAIQTSSIGKVPIMVKDNLHEVKQYLLPTIMSDKKIVQWDLRAGKIVQEYGAGTITSVKNNRQFITASGDNTLKLWEFGTPIVKYMSEQHVHTMPAIGIYPNGNWLAMHSSITENLNKKWFIGPIVATYACQVEEEANAEEDGKYEGKDVKVAEEEESNFKFETGMISRTSAVALPSHGDGTRNVYQKKGEAKKEGAEEQDSKTAMDKKTNAIMIQERDFQLETGTSRRTSAVALPPHEHVEGERDAKKGKKVVQGEAFSSSVNVSKDNTSEAGSSSRVVRLPRHEDAEFMAGRRRLFGTASIGLFGRQIGGSLRHSRGGAPPSPGPSSSRSWVVKASSPSPSARDLPAAFPIVAAPAPPLPALSSVVAAPTPPLPASSLVVPPSAPRLSTAAPVLPVPYLPTPVPVLPVPVPAPAVPAPHLPAPAPAVPALVLPAPDEGLASRPRRVHVANLPWRWRTQDLRRVFGKYNITKAQVILDKDTGRSLGFGFFNVPGAEALDLCILEMHGRPIDGRTISVSESTHK